MIVHVSRSLSDQLFRVGHSVALSFIRMFAFNWRMIVIGISGGMNCGLPSADMGSSSTRNRITPFTPTIPARKSRTCTTLAVPIPPQVAIMLVGVTSTGTRPCRLRSRPHHRRAADDPTTGCCAPVSVKPRAGPRIKPINSGCFGAELHPTTVLDAPSYNMKDDKLCNCAKASPGKKNLGCRLRSVLRCWILTLSCHMSKLSATVATGAFSQLGSSNTFCAVISRFVSEWCADVSVSSRWFLLEHSLTHDFLETA